MGDAQRFAQRSGYSSATDTAAAQGIGLKSYGRFTAGSAKKSTDISITQQ
jgi:hypothetical protein